MLSMDDEVDATLAALADPARRRVVEVLGEGPCRAGELAERIRMSAPATSRHLRVLRASGLVEVESVDGDARLRLYRLRTDRLVALRAWLDQVQAFWDEQLEAFRAHVERNRASEQRARRSEDA